MLLVVRASDGAAFSLYRKDLQDITTLDELRFNLLSPLLQIPPECLICMNEEGAQLRDESVPHLAILAGSPESSQTAQGARTGSTTLQRSSLERRLYVFDREHLDADAEEVARALAITDDQVLTEAPLSPQDPLPSHIGLSLHNLDTLRALIHSISLQRASLQLALSNLNRVMTGTSTSFSVFLEATTPNIERWTKLLEGWEDAMEAISKVQVVGGLLGRGGAGHARDGSTASSGMGKEKERYLGDYVSRDKMLAVRDGCAKVLAELKERSDALQVTLEEVLSGTQTVQEEFDATSRDLEDLEACEQDAEHAHARIEELVHAGEDMTDPELLAQCFDELSFFDVEHRDRIHFLVERKNAMTRYLIHSMQRISNLQSDIASTPTSLGELDHDFRTRTDNFKHLARLEGLIPAYVATVVEVVRRRKFSRLLAQHSTALSSSLTPLSTHERSLRTSYRSTFSGKLPWEVRGLAINTDEAIPALELDVKNSGDDLPELGRETLLGLQRSLAEWDEAMERGGEHEGKRAKVENPIKKARAMLDELAQSLDQLEEQFDKTALGTPPPEPTLSPAQVQEYESRLHALEELNEQLTRDLQAERSGREEELAQLNHEKSELAAARLAREDELAKAHDELASTRAEAERKQLVGQEDSRRSADIARKAEQVVAKRLAEVEERHSTLQAEHVTRSGELAQARTLVQELEAAIKTVESSKRDLTLVVAEKERLLRDQRGEAELDRAVLEKELEDLHAMIRRKDTEVKDGVVRVTTLEEVVGGLRAQVARWETATAEKESEVGAAKEEIERTRQEKEVGIVEVRRELVKAEKVARQALKAAGELKDENGKIIALLSATPTPSKSDSSADNVEVADVVPLPTDEAASTPPLDFDGADLEELLAEIQKYSADPLADAVKSKVESLTHTTKKWIKEAKSYRERAHRSAGTASDKIAFRNFTKGDLALFLPTRNSAVPVWAAFNVSFPHHFLSATGVISEQMKTREWIVARITSLTEKVVDAKDPSSNPYLLAAGTKFFLLEVEPWSSKDSSSRSRKHSSPSKSKSNGDKRPEGPGHLRSRASESAVPTSRPLSTAESAILVEAPTPSTPPHIRRTMSEGGGLPPNATPMARSEYAIVEEDESDHRSPSPTTLRQPVPRSDEPYSGAPASSSALAISLARSTPSSPSVQARADPFNPFGTTSSPPAGDGINPSSPTVSPPPTDFEPTITPAGAVPAFLPSHGGHSKKSALSASGSTSSSAGHATTSPRYVRSTVRPSTSTITVSGALPIPATPTSISSKSASQRHLSSSPASTTGSYAAFPRSASSGSSILSASMMRRAGGGGGVPGAFPSSVGSGSISLEKAQATLEAQTGDSKWEKRLLEEDLAKASREDGAIRRASTVGRKEGTRTSKGWPSSSAATGSGSGSGGTSSPAAERRSGSLSSSSVFEALTGRRMSMGATSGLGGGGAANAGAEGEMRKLLRKQ